MTWRGSKQKRPEIISRFRDIFAFKLKDSMFCSQGTALRSAATLASIHDYRFGLCTRHHQPPDGQILSVGGVSHHLWGARLQILTCSCQRSVIGYGCDPRGQARWAQTRPIAQSSPRILACSTGHTCPLGHWSFVPY